MYLYIIYTCWSFMIKDTFYQEVFLSSFFIIYLSKHSQMFLTKSLSDKGIIALGLEQWALLSTQTGLN